MPNIRVLSYNIRHGEGMDNRIDLWRIAKIIESISPDLVSLQEVDYQMERTGGIDQAEELALGRRERGIRHHIEQPDMQLADLLMDRVVRRQHGFALALQAFKCRQIRVGDKRHNKNSHVIASAVGVSPGAQAPVRSARGNRLRSSPWPAPR